MVVSTYFGGWKRFNNDLISLVINTINQIKLQGKTTIKFTFFWLFSSPNTQLETKARACHTLQSPASPTDC
jgi:hypothetical protein